VSSVSVADIYLILDRLDCYDTPRWLAIGVSHFLDVREYPRASVDSRRNVGEICWLRIATLRSAVQMFYTEHSCGD
jgi:hypothetical protein